jgi:LuxR family maltose regulon positive regulatory protein
MSLTDTTTIRRFVAPARFEVPAPPLAYVPRPELIERLDDSSAPLTVVVGAIGTGKTALLGSWAGQRAGTTVWMACDPTDADPVRFWAALAEAVQRAAPDAGLDALARLDDDGQESVDAAASLATDCALLSDGAVVIDDLHLAGPSPVVLSAFVRSLPSGVRLALASRRDPPFPLGRLRVQGRVLEIRDRELGFDLPTARGLFERLDIDVEEADLARLCELTEGWPAGLQLAALSLTGRDDAGGFVREFADTDRGVADFLVNEVLDQQPAAVTDFLMETSVLDSFDASLCAAVTGRADAGDMLRWVHESHLFVIELDRHRGWYRYHHLFGAFLRGRLRAASEERFRAAHTAASRELARRGDVMGAVDHAMAAGEVHAAFELVRTLALSQLDLESRAPALDTVRAWLRQYGARYIETEPRLVVECCILLETFSAPDDVVTWLRRIEQSGPRASEPSCAGVVAALWGLHNLQRGNPVAALEHVERALGILGDDVADDIWVSQWTSVAGPAHLMLDDTDAVRGAVAAGRKASAGVTVLDSVRMPGLLAWAAAIDGELPDAEAQARLALDAADSLGLAPSNFGRVLPVLSLAAVAGERNDLVEATRLSTLALDAAERARRRFVLLSCLLERARLTWSEGDGEASLLLLDRARQVMPQATPEVTDHVNRLEAAFAIDAGNPKADALVESLRPTAFRALLEARLLLLHGDARSAVSVLADAEELMRSRRLRVRHGLLEARALSRRNRERGMERLESALRLAQPAGLLRTVIDEGAEVHGLVEALPVDGHLDPFVRAILDAVYRRPTARRPAERQPVDGLSDREHEVLRYLASRLSYSEMAGELFISVNTLKSHLKAVYRKLGVSTRAEAVQTARQSGLL